MSNIWLDVTTILSWTRPAVGIIRVESETASYFLASKLKNIRFCRFDLQNKQYFEVPQEKVQEALDTIRQGKPLIKKQQETESSPVVAPAKPFVSIEQRVKNILLKVINLLPTKLRSKTLRFASTRLNGYYAAVRAYRELRLFVQEFISPSTTPLITLVTEVMETSLSTKIKTPFRSDDIYLSLGLDWDQKDLEYLFSEKQSTGFKVILICYDIIPVKYQHLFFGEVASRFALYFSNLAWCADEVLCISECTKIDLTNLLFNLGTPIPPMSVIKLGCELPTYHKELQSTEVGNLAKSKFIIMVSTIERRKNHEILYRAYTCLVEKGIKDLPLLIFVGMPGWGVDELLSDLRLDHRIKPYIRIMNHVSDSDLAWLYKNTEFTVFPSLYEGWGIPIAESLAAGKFCLASNAASIPEVGGDLVEYIDPWDLPTWVKRLEWYFEHPEEVAIRNIRCKNEYHSPAWADTAAHILDIANNLGKQYERSSHSKLLNDNHSL